jgi:tetratricopeptide (TPR) repeat protein
MTQKFTRKDLKRNELVDTVGKTVGYVQTHRRGVVEAMVAGAVALLLVGGFFLFRTWRQREAGKELSAALEVLSMPLATDPTAATAPKTYPTAADRQREAEKHLRAAADKKGTPAGRAAALILATRESKPAEAEKSVLAVAESAHGETAASAEIDAARLLAAQGKSVEAIDRLKRSIEGARPDMPKDALLFALGEIAQASGASGEAKAAFQRIVTEFPSSPYRADAQRLAGS